MFYQPRESGIGGVWLLDSIQEAVPGGWTRNCKIPVAVPAETMVHIVDSCVQNIEMSSAG